MRPKRSSKEYGVIFIIIFAIIASIGFASVFAYYPMTMNVAPVAPPVQFQFGSNANQQDLGSGNTIGVTLGDNYVSASITIHPTRQTTYYKDVLKIKNTDNKAYSVYIRIVEAAYLGLAGSEAKICIFKTGPRGMTGHPKPSPTGVTCYDLTTTGTHSLGSLSAGGTWEVDFYVYIPEGGTLPSQTTANLYLIYSPSAESPP